MTSHRAIRWTVRIFASMAIVAVITEVFLHVVSANSTTIALTMLLAVLGIATTWGLAEALIASIAAVIAFNYFFLPPVRTLTISDPQNWVALAAFLVTAVTASQLSVRARRRAAEAEQRRIEVERLYALGQSLLLSSDQGSMARETLNRIMQIFGIARAALYLKLEDNFVRSELDLSSVSDQDLRESADRCEPEIDKQREVALVPVRLGGQALGSLAFSGGLPSTTGLNAVAYLVAIGIERARALKEAGRIEVARQSERLKAALLDALAHDFKTPLTSIKGALTHLLGREHDTEEMELLTLANEETDRLNMLVVEVIEMARIEAAKLHPERRPLDIATVISAVLSECDSQMKTREITAIIPADLPPAEADSDFIQQVLKQLLDNAFKYTPPGSPIVISAEADGSKVMIHVSDRGPGIDEQEQTAIFDKFYRGRRWRYDVRGTGLGLSIAKGIVEAHGGKIWVESQAGAGCVFTFSLPAVKKEVVS